MIRAVSRWTATGTCYVADTYNHRVQKFNSTGGFITKWGGSGSLNGTFLFADDIAVDGNGFVYVADRMNHRIQKFTSDGTFVTKWGTAGAGDSHFEMLSSVAASSGGDVYAVDRSAKVVKRFTSDGTFVTQWGSNGTADGEFIWPYGVAVDPSGNVWVVDELNPCVQVFTPDGSFVAKWGTNGSAPGELNRPRRISVADTVFVADSFNVRVQEFTLDGGFVTALGAPGSATNPFQFPVDVVPDGHGSIYVADAGFMDSDVIKKFTRVTPAPPVAGFSADPAGGQAPLTVQFTDTSTGEVTNRSWDFGDGGGSTEQNPVHTYTAVGTYTVNLTVTNAGGSDSEVKAGFITVTPAVSVIPGGADRPTDPDRDGKYDDVNGNGRPDFADVVLYFNQMTWIAANEPVPAFDYNGNGRVDFADVVWLFTNL